jgi:hypothetical protein
MESDSHLVGIKKFRALKVIGMRVRVDHIFDVLLFNSIVGHPVEKIGKIAREPRIDQSLNTAADIIAVAVVVEVVCPLINVDIIAVFHFPSFLV